MQKLMKRLHKNEKGFTLVELMVVVVIIGILVAIAIPIYNNVQDTAKEKACFASQRTIEGAASMYNAEVGAWPATVGAMNTAVDGKGPWLQGLPKCPDATSASTGYAITDGKVTGGGAGCTHTHYSGTAF